MVLTMLFGSVIDYSYSNSNSSVTEQPAKEENVTTLDTQLANPNLSVVDNMTKPEYLETEKPNATSDKIKSEEQTEKVKQVEPDKEGLRELSEDNPDHLTAPGKANPVPRILDMKADPYLGNNFFKKLYSLRSDDSSPEPERVKLYKTVKAVAGKVNTFEVKLRIEAKDEENTNDIVLVIDTSGSMKDNDRMENAKIAAKKFVEQLLNDKHPKTRIALVTFSEGASLETNFTNYENRDDLIDEIDKLEAEGGTFTQAGLNEARDQLNKSKARYKNIVLLSDGVPTYGYEIKNPDNYLIREYINNLGERSVTSSVVPENEFNYRKSLGSGKSMFYFYGSDGWNPYYDDKYYNFGNSAIAEAGFAKDKGITIHSIAMQAGETGQSVLDDIASTGKSHSTDNPEELSGIFEEIANSISAAMSDVTVNDPMGTGFEVQGGEASKLEPSQGTAKLNGNEIDWNVGKTLEKSVEGDPLTHYAEMTYQVEVNDSILGADSEDGKYFTNNGATVSYTDINGERKEGIKFPEPQAEPLIIGFYKQIQDSRGNLIPDEKVSDREVTYNMARDNDPNAPNYNYKVKPGSPKIMVDIKLDDKYTFKETIGKDNYASSSVKWETFDKTKNGESNNEIIKDFTIPRVNDNGVTKYLNTKFIVTNKEKNDGTLTLTKVFDQNKENSEQKNNGKKAAYKVKVVGVSPYFEEKDGEKKYIVYPEQEFTLKVGEPLELKELPYGNYTVTEVGYKPEFEDNYGKADDGKVSVLFGKKNASVKIINKNDAKTEVTATKIWKDGPEADHTAPTLDLYADGKTKVGVTPTITPENGTSAEFKYKWTDLPKYDSDGNEIVYSVKEQNVTDGKVTINGHTYAVTQNENNITNTYKQPSNGTVKVTKTWKDPEGKTIAKPDVNLTLYRKIANGTEEKVPKEEAAVKVVNGETTTAEWTGLKETDLNGNPYTFIVKERFKNPKDVNNGNWTLVESTAVKEGKANITNNVKAGEASLTIKKVFINEANANEPGNAGKAGEKALEFKFKVTGPGGYTKDVTLKAGEEKVLDNLLYGEYKVEETKADGFSVSYKNQSVTLTSENKTATVTVTNQNDGTDDSNVTKTVEKVWKNGPKPAVTLELWRTNKLDGEEKDGKIDEKVASFNVPANASGDALKKTFKKLAKYDPKGNEYEYYAKEANVPVNYTSEVKGLTVTNTYTQPANGNVEVTKTWKNPEGKTIAKPDVNLKLYRKIKDGKEEAVPKEEAEVKVVNGETTTAEWTGLKETDTNGNPYTFIVKESFKDKDDVNNGNWTLVESTEIKDGSANIINKVKAGEASLTIKKVFINEANANEPGNAPGEAGDKALKFTFKVTGPGGYTENVTLKAGEETVLKNLLYGEYKVEETKVDGFDVSYKNQSVTLTSENKTATVTVTNQNDGTDASNVTKTVEKVWNNGPKPAVILELWRKSKGVPDGEKVNEFTTEEGKDSEHTFKTTSKDVLLAKYDAKGNEYEYYAKEENVPANYTSEVNGLTVTNTYTQPSNGKVKVTKTWTDPEGKTIAKPDVNLTLYRKIADGTEEIVPKAEVKVVNGKTTTAEWTGLKETDINGNPYTFIVKESFKNADDVNNGNWTLVKSTEVKEGKANITNKVKAGEASLTIKKVFINEANANKPGNAGKAGENALKFTFEVTGPGGFKENVTLKAGEEKVLDKLLYGEYKVKETKVDGFTVTYNNQSVTLTSENKKATVTVTNKNDGSEKSNVEKTVKKVWEDGPKPAVTLQLWRKSAGIPDGEIVNEFTTEKGKDSEQTFKTTSNGVLLAKYDAKGNLYEYYAQEEKVPANYQSKVEGLTVTNTYTENPSMKLEKSSKQNSFTNEGDVITFTFKITNTGDVEISNVMLTDEMLGIKNEIVVPLLKPGESKTIEKTYKVTAADVKKGKIVNAARVTGTTPGGTPPTGTDTHTIIGKPPVTNKPNTGDNTDNLYMYIGLLGVALMAFSARKKQL